MQYLKSPGRPSYLFFYFGITGIFLGICSCIPKKNSGSGSSVSAVVDIIGLEPGDESLAGLNYSLVCRTGMNASDTKIVPGKIENPGLVNPKVDFPEEELAIGSKCALEIRATAVANEEGTFKWLAFKDGKPVPGLFYRSSEAVVELFNDPQQNRTSKYLKVQLFKVYGIDYKDPFEVSVKIQFNKESPDDLIPKSEGILASIHCSPSGSADEKLKFQESTSEIAEVPTTTSHDERQFIFSLSAHKMTNTQCDKVTIAIANVLIYEGPLKNVAFIRPTMKDSFQKNPQLSFGPFTVSSAQESYAAVSCAAQDATAKLCTEVKFDTVMPIWMVLAQAVPTTGSQTPVDIVVMSKNPLTPDSAPSTSKAIAAMNAEIAAGSGTQFSFYKAEALAGILSAEFNQAALQAALTGKQYDFAANPTSKITVRSLKEAYYHGFKTVSESNLNAREQARWFALIDASDGSTQNRFVVAGLDKYFFTPKNSRPAVTSYFTVAHFKLNYLPSAHKYRSYAISSGGIDQASCSIPLNYYRQTLSQSYLSGIGSGNNADLDRCEISDGNLLSKYADPKWSLSPRFYVWDWHKTTL